MTVRNWFGRQRCGWCIDGLHPKCVVVVEMNTDKDRGRPKDRRKEVRDLKKPKPYVWRCGCSCEQAGQNKCPNCQRVGIALAKDHYLCDDCMGSVKV